MRRSESKSRNKPASDALNRALHVVARIRRGETLSKAARAEHIKPETVRRYLGSALRQTSSGKRWIASKFDRQTANMNVLTSQGLVTRPVRGSIERSRLGRYNKALAQWRRGDAGAASKLATFKGQKVGGEALVTDERELATLESAGSIDFSELYSSIATGK
jgi:hypothetical protein